METSFLCISWDWFSPLDSVSIGFFIFKLSTVILNRFSDCYLGYTPPPVCIICIFYSWIWVCIYPSFFAFCLSDQCLTPFSLSMTEPVDSSPSLTLWSANLICNDVMFPSRLLRIVLHTSEWNPTAWRDPEKHTHSKIIHLQLCFEITSF